MIAPLEEVAEPEGFAILRNCMLRDEMQWTWSSETSQLLPRASYIKAEIDIGR